MITTELKFLNLTMLVLGMIAVVFLLSVIAAVYWDSSVQDMQVFKDSMKLAPPLLVNVGIYLLGQVRYKSGRDSAGNKTTLVGGVLSLVIIGASLFIRMVL